MTLTARAASSTAVRRAGLLLLLTLPAYVLFAVVAHMSMPVDTSVELTPAQLDGMPVAWAAMHVLWAAPVVLAAVGLLLLARERRIPAVPALAGVAIVAMAAYVAVEVALLGTGTATLGDSGLYTWGLLLSLVAGWAGILPATILTCVALARAGIVRRTAWAVAALTALYLALELLIYLPALLGPAELADTIGLPPALMGILWAVLGGGLMRARVPSRE